MNLTFTDEVIDTTKETELKTWLKLIEDCCNGSRSVENVSTSESIMVALALNDMNILKDDYNTKDEHVMLNRLSASQRKALLVFKSNSYSHL